MKVFSIIGDKKMREDIAPKIIKALEDDGKTVGFIKRTENISSNSQTKKAVIWGEHQSLFYHENKSSLLDLLKLFDEEYVVVDNDEKSNIPKLLMYEEVNLENTADVNELGNMHNMKRREDVFFTAEKDTGFDDIMKEILDLEYDIDPDIASDSMGDGEISGIDLIENILDGTALKEESLEKEDVELIIDDTALKMEPFVKAILKNSVEAVAKELDGYKEDTDLKVLVRK